MIRILHTADWHIGRFKGPEGYGQNNARFSDICSSIDLLVAGAKVQKPDIAVIAGDVFHQARTWSDRGLTEVRTAIDYIRMLEEICPVVVMRGTPNHDGESHFNMLKTTFEGNDNVHIVTEPGVITCRSYDGKTVQVACLPGFDRGYFRAKNPGLPKDEENNVFTKAIEDMIIGLKAQCSEKYPTVLVSHYTITGCNMESGQTAFFSQFEPVVYPSTLAVADFDLVCFGHIHRPQQIDGCKNTFYCGALAQLNFNDEGQKRGYYIHDIDENRVVKSTFLKVTTREHKTLYLNDGDIKEINEDGKQWLSNYLALNENELICEIVRVLYDCTDEHNKAFNHAVFERYLYDIAGVYWVQEITPQKISITVDRKSLSADSTPEDNLNEYLKEKELDPIKIGELTEIARPIMSTATEKATAEHKTGLFVPEEIEVRNYRNYKSEKFSFDDIRFCTINGSNGAGKSSLFMDAMLDALFEETREGELTGWICNDPQVRSGSIKFTFKIGETSYRVTRTRQKSGKATLNISEFLNGEWIDRSKEKFKDTQTQINNIIGMDSLTLKACALIMQDQYGLFLEADKEARMNILGTILGLEIYSDMEELTAEKAKDTNRKIRNLSEQIDTVMESMADPEELNNVIEASQEIKQTYEEQASEKAIETERLKSKLNDMVEANQRIDELKNKIANLTAEKTGKESLRTAQAAIVAEADKILFEEAIINTGVKRYEALLEQEKELWKDKAQYDNYKNRKSRIQEEINQAKHTVAEYQNKKSEILAKIEPLQQSLEYEAELEKKHGEYISTARQIATMEELEPEWNAEKSKVESAEAEIKRIDSEYETAYSHFRTRYDSLVKKVSLLEDSGCPDVENAHCKFLTDALTAKDELPEIDRKLKEIGQIYADTRLKASETLETAKKALADTRYDPDEITALRSRLRSLESDEKVYLKLETQKNELTLLMQRSEELENSIQEAEESAEIRTEELTRVEKRLNELAMVSTKYEKLTLEIEETKIWVNKEKQLPVAREKKQAATRRIQELDNEIEQITVQLAETRAEIDSDRVTAGDIQALQSQIRQCETQSKTLQEMLQKQLMELGGLKEKQKQLAEKTNQIAEMQSEVNVLGAEAANYEELKRAFSQNGIPHNIIRSIIPIFESTATNILSQMSQGKMSVEFVTEKVLKSNNKKEVTTLDIIINDADTGRLPYMSRSGGERVKAALSVILALSEIKSSKAGMQLGFLFIDEPPFLDEPGVQAYCDALEAIQKRYSDLKVMAITHDPTMKSRFPQSIDVIKTSQGSKVVYD